MSNCRSGCKERSHNSYAECLQAANIRVADTINSPLQSVYDNTKKDLKAYADARKAGIQPEGTTRDKVQNAHAASNLLGRPYNANSDAPAYMINSKNTAHAVNVMASED